jgi:hypothetical protein
MKHTNKLILLSTICVITINTMSVHAQQKDNTRVPIQRDGSHDFDFEIGTWKTELKRLQHPLTGSSLWVEYSGTTVVSKVWSGRANLVELDVTGPSGHIEALSLRLYNKEP